METQLPPIVYYVAGAIILSNLGVVVTIFVASIKGTWWLSKLLTELNAKADKAQDTGVRAHKRIDKLEGNA